MKSVFLYGGFSGDNTRMAKEIERKFLVRNADWRAAAHKTTLIRQGYLSADGDRTVRVRVKGDEAFVTIKGRPTGIARAEYEYAIPLTDANEMLDTLCVRPLIEKRRSLVAHGRFVWEVDEFLNENAPLVVAELEHEDAESATADDLPAWVGQEVTGEARYQNSNLSRRPFSTW